MRKLLIVDDDNSIRNFMRLLLIHEGFEVIEAQDGKAALEILLQEKVDLVIIDVMMPRLDGFSLCQEIKKEYDLPVIFVTAKGETMDKVKGFQKGSDDYLVKPFEPIELVMRIKAILKRYQIISSQQLIIGDISVNLKGREVKVNKDIIEFPPKEYDLFLTLVSHPNQIFTRNQLIETIWGFDFEGDDRTIDVHIKRIRKRLELSKSVIITTIRGLGYKAEVKE